MARAAKAPMSGAMRMSVIPTIAPFLLPRLLPQLRRDYPDLQLFLREEPSGAACENLHQGRIAGALLALPYPCGDVGRKLVVLAAMLVVELVPRRKVEAEVPHIAV